MIIGFISLLLFPFRSRLLLAPSWCRGTCTAGFFFSRACLPVRNDRPVRVGGGRTSWNDRSLCPLSSLPPLPHPVSTFPSSLFFHFFFASTGVGLCLFFFSSFSPSPGRRSSIDHILYFSLIPLIPLIFPPGHFPGLFLLYFFYLMNSFFAPFSQVRRHVPEICGGM